MSFTIHTSCAHCGQPLQFEMDNHLNYTVQEKDAAPIVFSPLVDFGKLEDPSIIDAF
jgi:hypothetical protein